MDRASVATRFKDVLDREFLVDISRISDTTTFEELGLDSLDMLTLVEAVQEEFQLKQSVSRFSEVETIRLIGRAIDIIVDITK
ncbi:acyl carrier protein [Pseudomonas sp. G.S.17]|uniref:acyl carrier protein n=1 Tax=Pseudomonas sp. G.S.17 TaxID=3137451 RepID=UPI00311CA8A2